MGLATLGPDYRRGVELDEVLAALAAREPLFHRRDLVNSPETFDAEVADDFWEVGASGRVYDRAFVREVVLRRLKEPVDAADAEGWRISDEAVRPLGADTYLFTYVLHAPDRVTRRATLWHRTPTGWQALYHQGTVIA